MTRQTLSIGENIDIVDESVEWDEERNIRDFKIAFANLRTINKISEKEGPAGNVIYPEETELYEHLSAGNYIFIILPEERKIGKGVVLDAVNWIPFDLGMEEESGRSVQEESISEEWEWYFDGGNFTWNICMENIGREVLQERILDPESPGIKHSEKIFYELDSLAMNRYGKCLAGKIRLGSVEVKDINFIDMRNPQRSSPDYKDGKLYLLPLIEGYDYESLVEGILENLFGVSLSNEKDTPGWTEEYTVPGEKEVERRLDEVDEMIRKLGLEREEKEVELGELRRYKGLLYGNEDFLEELVPEVLDEIGFDVEGEIPHGRDGAILLDDTMMVLEITGTKGGVSLKKCRQLNNWVDEYRYSETENPKQECVGILIINPFREKKPDKRTGYIDNNTERFMRDRNHKILTTPALFQLYTEYERGNISEQEVEELLTNNETVINRDSLV
ncbi:MAG: hypothetical protein U5J64_12195 [Halobacteriales archaeon]|nr:hypothetical protein [Halobacteriales archaeon]